ncbi:hypothetical protein [Haliea atlantica]
MKTLIYMTFALLGMLLVACDGGEPEGHMHDGEASAHAHGEDGHDDHAQDSGGGAPATRAFYGEEEVTEQDQTHHHDEAAEHEH